MPLSSVEIANMNGAFQGAAMQNMAYSGMLGMGGPHGGGGGMPMGEAVAGGTLNRMGAIGGPMAMGAMGIMGWDPMSAAIKGGMGAYKMGAGAMGIGAGAIGAAALPMGMMMGASYAGGQMFTGMQQQQNLNAGLRSGFQFMNPAAAGGRGFGMGEMGQIGGQLRQMAGQIGPTGEIAGFEELGRLASNMGRMGMGQGVRSAKEFSDRFKQMVGSLKEIATAFQTNLEEAQQMMGSMRGAGVFGAQKAVQFAKSVRAGAVAGGLATTEVTGMMSIGSQIARSIGGRGVAGARAGIETITNIGVAQQAGILSEEDIYNATGLTGAEGKQALATQQLQESGNFLKTGRGRWFLASLAGKNGQLNDASVREIMAGGVGTGRTQQMAHQNLQGVGRANFIRNEGRLRGEVLAKFGGLAQSVAYTGWLQERGFDVTNLDEDRANIAFQRFSGMGRDEAEAAVRMVKDLPRITERRRESEIEDRLTQKIGARDKMRGIEGIKRKFEAARNSVQNTLQEVGQRFYQDMGETVDRFVNTLTGKTVETYQRDVISAYGDVKRGGAAGAEAGRRVFGGGAALMGAGGAAALRGGPGAFQEFQASGDLERFQKAGFTFAGVGAERSGLMDRMFGVGPEAGSAERLQSRLAEIRGVGQGARTVRPDLVSIGDKNAPWFNELMASGTVTGSGEARIESFSRALAKGKVPLDVQRAWSTARTPQEKAGVIANLTRGAAGAGAGAQEAQLFEAPEMMSVLSQGGFATAEARQDAIAGFALTRRPGDRALMGATGRGGMAFIPGVDKATAERQLAMSAQMADPRVRRALGAFMDTESFRDLSVNMLTDSTREATKSQVVKRLGELQRKEAAVKRGDKDATLAAEDSAERFGLNSLRMAGDLAEIKSRHLTAKQEEAEISKLTEKYQKEGLVQSTDDFLRMANAPGAIASGKQRDALRQLGQAVGPKAREEIERLQQQGVLEQDSKTGRLTLSADAMKGIGKAVGKGGLAAAQTFINASLGIRAAERAMEGASPEEVLKQQGIIREQMGVAGGALGGMTVQQQRALGGALGGAGLEEGAQALQIASMRERVARKGGGLAGVAAGLGVNLGKTDLAELQKMRGGEQARRLAMGLGLTEEEIGKGAGKAVTEDILSALKSGKGSSEQAKLLLGASTAGVVREAQERKNLARAAETDPLQAKANESLKSIKENSDKMLVALNSISTNTQTPADKPEAKP